MSLLFRAGAPASESRAALPAGFVARLTGGHGVVVDADSAMRHDAVWACRTRIAQDVSMMPVDVIRRQGGERVFQPVAAPVYVDQFDLGARQCRRRRHHRQAGHESRPPWRGHRI